LIINKLLGVQVRLFNKSNKNYFFLFFFEFEAVMTLRIGNLAFKLIWAIFDVNNIFIINKFKSQKRILKFFLILFIFFNINNNTFLNRKFLIGIIFFLINNKTMKSGLG
jgi:hypothetical protein